ncbi:integrin beta-like protein 1 [Cygnus olor]|uniref:integrin beta-like protein 1 n=1 Tax=Cygnus olor TaxID=8869 RepID=UPI001ADDF1BF|nr:integrin beta-like protein 1 [Cygnus olor]XP_040393786.1 integrin beta-like protein 1 [Cygnus olor]
MCTRGLPGLALLVVAITSLPGLRPAAPPSLRSALGSPAACHLSRAEAELRCRVPGGQLCSGRGRCNCGVCICQVTEAGKYYGPLCECHDWVCETYDGKICAGHGKCDCGKCKCDEGWYGEACQYPTSCNLTRKKSNEMCKNSQDIICSGAGTCQCGRCKCANSEGNGLVYGKFCECDDRECIDDETEEICTGHGKCYCGNCYCEAGWHGDKCEFQCDITPWEIKKRCTSPDGKICSNRGTCVCGECTCHDVDPTGDWGDIHGDTCECDERNCKAVYDRYSDDFCSGHGQCNCGRCDCKEGWTGKKCEHPRSCPLSAEESAKKCQGNSNLPCSGRGKCECGQCTCFPPGDNRVHGKNCECDDRQCESADGEVCGGHGICSCGRCICQNGWFGKLCQHSRKCNMTEEESRSLCESEDGVLCSGKGSCHCGKCICSPQEWYISGDFCECDDRDCDKHDGLICTGNGVCNCGNCECWEGWNGNACEIWLGTEYP